MMTRALSAKRSEISARQMMTAMAAAVVGGIFGYGLMKLLIALHLQPKVISWSEILGLAIGAGFLVYGGIVFYLSFRRRMVARALEGDEAVLPATDMEVRVLRLQSFVLGLSGLLLMAPVVGNAEIRSLSVAGGMVFLGIVLLFGLQTWLNVRLWKSCDEFLRRQILVSAAITFAVGQGVLFLWAAGEMLHLAPAASAWDILTLAMALYLLSSFRAQLLVGRCEL